VTFLFTDIEGSTTLWEQCADAMRTALAHHDVLLRRAIEEFDGRVIKSTGDGLYAVFELASDALLASLAAQRALQASPTSSSDPKVSTTAISPPVPLRVRMGLHTGTAEFRDGDYFGVSLNRAARIMSSAHGGQVLLSVPTAELVRAQLPEGVTLRDMGVHRLKGLLEPERLLQLVASDLRVDFPPLTSLTAHSLRAERDAFIGRLESLDELARRMHAGARLVSIIGFGGTGKTRLATRFGWRSLGEFAGGVWFCDLSQARSADGILHAVALGLDVPLGKDDPVIQLGHAIAGRGKCLVILDNFEQVVRHADQTLGCWLNRAHDARFLVTTREVLGLPGEEVLALAPLPLADAAALFLGRAEAAQPGFQPNADDRSAITPLVKLLEGLPLAIELAAARVRVMSPRTLLLRMSERFKVLASTGGRMDRQATLRAVLDWSWDLLSPAEKAALAQLSVFEGGFTLESAEAVLDLSAYENAPWPADALQSLVQKSLVRQTTNERFDLLVSVQEYATEQLRTVGRYAGSGAAALLAAEARHSAYFADFDEKRAVAQACVELDNLVVACRRAAVRQDADVATRALESAWAGLNLRGPSAVGLELALRVQTIDGLGGATAARIDWVAGCALEASGKNSDAYLRFEASLARAREGGDRRCECKALMSLAFRDVDAGRADACRVYADAALILASELNDRTLEGRAHNPLAILEESLGRLDEAKTHYEAGLALAREAGDSALAGHLLSNLGGLYTDEGSADDAERHFAAAVAIARDVGDRRLEAITLGNLGWLCWIRGRFDEALLQLETALAMARDMGLAQFECFVLLNIGIVCQKMNRFDEAKARIEAALVLARDLRNQRFEGQALCHAGLLHAHKGYFDEARRCLDSGTSLLRALHDRVDLGKALCSRAEMEYLAGAVGAAQAAVVEASHLAMASRSGARSQLGIAVARVLALLGLAPSAEVEGPIAE